MSIIMCGRLTLLALTLLATQWQWCARAQGAHQDTPETSAPYSNAQPTEALREAGSLLNTGKLTEAEALLRHALAQNAFSPELHFLLGDVLFREHKPSDSLTEFTAGARGKRPGPYDFRIVASDYVLLGDFVDADKWFTEVTAETPNDPEAWYLLGRTKYDENRFEEAITSFQRVLSLRPNDVRAENNLGLSVQGLGRTAEAKAAFQKSIDWQAAAPRDEQPYLNQGSLLVDQGEVDSALQSLLKAESLAPDNPKIHEELGRAYLAKGDLANAQMQLEKAVAIAPKASSLHFKLGQIYHRRGLAERAHQEFDICAKLNGSHSSVEVPNPFSGSGPSKP